MLEDWQTESEASIRNATLLEAYSTATQSLKISINYLILKQIHFNHENEVCYKWHIKRLFTSTINSSEKQQLPPKIFFISFNFKNLF